MIVPIMHQIYKEITTVANGNKHSEPKQKVIEH